jgi:biopolymer transport protein ExbD
MTPFIDIMLVLLIIFMVSSSVGLETGLDIEVPKSSKSEASKGETKGGVVKFG